MSAGVAYGASYASEQFERNREVNLKYTADPRYMSFRNLITKGNLFDWDFVYNEIPNKLIPFDYDTLHQSSTEFKIGITNVETGDIRFVSGNKLSNADLMQAITASSSLPFVSHFVSFQDELYMDGGIADSIPVKQAITDGYPKAVVILTRNKGYRKEPIKQTRLVRWRYRKYPQLAEAILSRAERYNQTLDQLYRLEAEGKVFIIQPQGTMNVSRIENKPDKLDHLYKMGIKEAEQLLPQLTRWLEQ